MNSKRSAEAISAKPNHLNNRNNDENLVPSTVASSSNYELPSKMRTSSMPRLKRARSAGTSSSMAQRFKTVRTALKMVTSLPTNLAANEKSKRSTEQASALTQSISGSSHSSILSNISSKIRNKKSKFAPILSSTAQNSGFGSENYSTITSDEEFSSFDKKKKSNASSTAPSLPSSMQAVLDNIPELKDI